MSEQESLGMEMVKVRSMSYSIMPSAKSVLIMIHEQETFAELVVWTQLLHTEVDLYDAFSTHAYDCRLRDQGTKGYVLCASSSSRPKCPVPVCTALARTYQRTATQVNVMIV